LRRVSGIAFCPCPPVLVPEVAQGAASDLDELRAACDLAVHDVLEGAGSVLVLGAGRKAMLYPSDAAGTFAGYGVPVRAGGDGAAELPLALTMGAWLLDRADAGSDRGVPRRYVEVAQAGGGPAQPWFDDAVAVLVMGDGPACLSERAPGGLDPAAAAYDDAIVAALESGDPDRLLALDPVEGSRVMAAGVPAWHALGSALLAEADAVRGTTWASRLLAREAPFGVSYVVASWERPS